MSVYALPPQMTSHNPTPVSQPVFHNPNSNQPPHVQQPQYPGQNNYQQHPANVGYSSSTPSGVTSPTHSTITITNGTTIPVAHPPTIHGTTPIISGKPVQGGVAPVHPEISSSGGIIVFNPATGTQTGVGSAPDKSQGGPIVLAPPGGGPIVVVDANKPNTGVQEPNGATVVFNPAKGDSSTVHSGSTTVYHPPTTNSSVVQSGSNTVYDSAVVRTGTLAIPREIIDKVKWETEACFYVPIAAKELAEKGVIHLPLNEVEKTKAHQLLDYCLFGEGANLYRNVLAKGDALRFREKLASFEKKAEPKTEINISSIKDQLKFELKNDLLAQLKSELKAELRSQLRAEIMDEVHTEISKINGRIDKLQNYVVDLHNKQNDELSARIVAVANRVDGLKREYNTFVDQVHIKDMNKVLLAAGRWAHPVPTLKGNYGPDSLETWNDGRWTLYVPDVIKNLPSDQLDQWLESYCIGEHSRNFGFLRDVPVHVKKAILFHFIGGKCDPEFFPNEQKVLHF
ncbi:hypothetical protein I302_100360 [Kwoniella bestiolae CBS 10118]|uniref:Uncharacterized protein n=1 Tax=Kwoniella bestiolae CBS 10118 TaxID=1296100 RepID=A0A1B9G4W4_9TREE|nr:hypothetical protein I302_03733 [Kwoniella bestiolae CBS 10118]OCF26056.1 hypothetical protein I302_03733 [Kwoniella bestiolae CBS 10118]